MFGPNATRTKVLKEDGYTLPLTSPVQLDIQVPVESGKLIPSVEFQPAFDELRQRVLLELPKNKQLFKSAPSYASLDSITPPWGFVTTSSGVSLSPYLQISSSVEDDFTGKVTFSLIAVLISRSSVIPHFQIEPVKTVIELDWAQDDELAEVSDIPSADEVSELRLIDPAAKERKKQAEKERIRELFRVAEAEAAEWLEKYNPSDTESAFSEWMGEDEDEAHS